MQAYFVRAATDRQVVGIFAAESLANLRELVDFCTDPAGCEYLVAGEGGIVQSAATTAQFPPRNTGEPDYEVLAEDENPFASPSYTDGWDARLDKLNGWRPLGPL